MSGCRNSKARLLSSVALSHPGPRAFRSGPSASPRALPDENPEVIPYGSIKGTGSTALLPHVNPEVFLLVQ